MAKPRSLLTLCFIMEVQFGQVMFWFSKEQTPVPQHLINGVSSKQGWAFYQGSSSYGAQEFSPSRCRWALTSHAYFFILRISVSFYFCGFFFFKNNNLFCAYYYVATVKKAQGMTHCHLNTSFAFLPPHFGSCPSPHDALAASGLPRKATCLQASAPLWRLPFPGQCCLSPWSSCSPCSPHCLPNTRTTWCIFSGMDKHLLYPISENRL